MTVLLMVYLALLVMLVAWLLTSIAFATRRAFRRWRIRRELRILRGGREPVFTSYSDLVERPAKPPMRSLRRRGDNDAA